MDTQPSRLTISTVGPRWIAASGIIDSHTADVLSAHIDELGPEADIEVQLTEVEFIDSSGLRAIIAAHQSLDKEGHKLVLTGLSEPVNRLLHITGLQDHLHTA